MKGNLECENCGNEMENVDGDLWLCPECNQEAVVKWR